MRERIGIVAVAQTPYEPAHDKWRSHELTYHTVERFYRIQAWNLEMMVRA